MSISIILIMTIIAVSVLLWNRFGISEEDATPEFVLSYAENQNADHPSTKGAVRFAEMVKERTNGRILILIKDEGQMGTETEVLKQMKYGGIDFARVSISQLAGYAPELNVLQMPYLYEDSEHMWRVLDGELGDAFLSNVSDQDFVGLSWYDAGSRSFYTAGRQIKTIEDVQGLRIRVQDSSQLMTDVITALGGVPVPMDYAKVYSAIETGEVDGAENNWPSFESMRHYEVAKYFTLDEHTRVPEMQLVSAHTWEKLSKEDQAIIIECARESSLYERKLWNQQESKAKEAAIAGGTEVFEMSPEEKARFREAMTEVYEKYCGNSMDIIERIIAY
ncbi:MAG: TRAP transporter substrate-binding protein [Pseudobutyrivibrio sp.]|nr:TRAP transporter substrate-binding protein [Pseudobutyrivibrio sp.]